MKHLFTRALFLMSFFILFTACEEQEISFIPTGASSFPSEGRVEASFYGRLLNQDLQPVIRAEVWIGDHMVLSDSLGDWIIPKIDVTSRQVYVKVVAEGYFAASRVLSVLPGSINLVRILPTQKQTFQSIQSNVGGKVVLPDGSSLTFQASSFIEEDSGLPYDGEVKVYAYSIDGRSESSQVQMPGRLESTIEDAALISFGMIVTELESPSGVQLQLKEGLAATIRYEQAELSSSAPDSIPLWYFEEGIGTWMKEGYSVREGNAYIGEVAHFTWWNCDIGIPLVDFCFKYVCSDVVSTIDGRGNFAKRICTSINVETTGGQTFKFNDYPIIGETYCEMLPVNSKISINSKNSHGEEFIVKSFSTASSNVDLGSVLVDCDDISEFCWAQPYSPPPMVIPAPPPAPILCNLMWSNSNCDNANQNYWLRIVSTHFNATPIILSRPPLPNDSIEIIVLSDKRLFISMIDPETGEVIGEKQFMPRPQIDVGTLNPGSGVIGARPINVTGRLFDCAGVAGDVYVKLTNTEGEVVSESTSGPDGRFTLITNECDASLTTLTIAFSEGERTFAAELYDDRDFGDIRQCAADGNYYWRVKLNSEIFDYSICSGRAGANGWVAYASAVPDADAPLFGLLHNNKINNTGPYRVGPDEDVYFNVFRHDNHNMTGTTHPFSGILRVTEYGEVAAGVFTGSCVDGNGDTVTIEMEMRFEKP